MSIQSVTSLIERVKAKFILILCHRNADPDAMGAAFAFSQLLRRLKPELKVEIASPEGISKLSRVLLAALPIRLTSKDPNFKDADIIVMLDTNTIQQLGEWGEYIKGSSSPLVVIDHHASHPETEKIATICISREDFSSTCEIVYGFFRELELKPSKVEAEALFLGIAFDTKHFILANSSTFKTVAELIDAGVNAQETLSLLSLSMDPSERIARLKACRRMRLMKIDGWIIAFSHVRSYQASAARALIKMGAHLAFVAGQRGDEIQVSLRSNQEFYKQTGFHLGRDLAKPLGEYLHGMGGGHSTSAGMNGVGDLETVVKKAVRILREKLRKNL